MTEIRFHIHDLPDTSHYAGKDIAIDIETLGLNLHRDRLCLVQLSSGDGSSDIIRIDLNQKRPHNLISLLRDPKATKIFHFARFDLAGLYRTFRIMPAPVFCTKIASRLVRTYTDRHGLKDLCKELLNIELSKECQSSDWAAQSLSLQQLEYAASDVLHLHRLRDILLDRLIRDKRLLQAKACFRFLPTRVQLDLMGWSQDDIFSHRS